MIGLDTDAKVVELVNIVRGAERMIVAGEDLVAHTAHTAATALTDSRRCSVTVAAHRDHLHSSFRLWDRWEHQTECLDTGSKQDVEWEQEGRT